MVELFEDAFDESGVADSYCSKRPEVALFGSLGAWEQNE